MADPLPPGLGANKKILEINPALCQECRVVVKEESKSNRLFVDTRDDYLCRRAIGEKCLPQFFFSGDASVAKSLVFCETLNELEN